MRCALHDNPVTPLTVIQKEISKLGWRPDINIFNRSKVQSWDEKYDILCRIETKILKLEKS